MTDTIPADLLPRDGRFGCGPAKVRPEALRALAGTGTALMGTSHRQAPVRALVASVQEGLRTLYSLPEGYEVVLGNGGATAFWDVATFSLVRSLASHAVFGEFSAKFAAAVHRAPHLSEPVVTEGKPGSSVLPGVVHGADTYAWPHNETSTGASAPVRRIRGADHSALTLIDATSAVAAMEVDITEADAYYFAPQKGLASDGGLWMAILSSRAALRAERLHDERWIPETLDLWVAIRNSRTHQTLNTPAIATLFLIDQQLRWLLDHGGLPFAAARSRASSQVLYDWADACPVASPFVTDPAHRSPVVVTIDLTTSVPAAEVCRLLRANGIVDIEPYRKLGRNQIRVGVFPAVEPTDVEALTHCLDWAIARA